ncbi:MAG: hypothetical protein Q9176_007743 [Flavoplaca citrina]
MSDASASEEPVSPRRLDEYKELVGYVATQLNNCTLYIPAASPELRVTVDENTPSLPNDPSEIMPAKDYDGHWTRQQAESTTTCAHVIAPDCVTVAKYHNLHSAAGGTSFNFDFDCDAFIGARNLASCMASRQEPLFDRFANTRDDDVDVGMGATMDPADLDYNDNDCINNNNNSAAFNPLTHAHQQHNNDNDTTVTPSPIDLFLERETPFIFNNTANRLADCAPKVKLPPNPFTRLRASLERRRSDSSPISPSSSSALPNHRRTYRRLAPAPVPAPSLYLPHPSFSTTTSPTILTL